MFWEQEKIVDNQNNDIQIEPVCFLLLLLPNNAKPSPVRMLMILVKLP
jgi:hypothetical protein